MDGGRRPTPTAIRKLAGMKSKPVSGEPIPTKGHPACPIHLTGEARAEWNRLTDELDSMGLLSTADRGVIALYCISWQRWCKAETQLNSMGEIVAAPKTKSPMQNPWLSIANKAHEQCHKLMAEIGLSPSARTKIKMNQTDDKDTDLIF